MVYEDMRMGEETADVTRAKVIFLCGIPTLKGNEM